MEAAFEEMKKQRKNDVDSLIKWMKDSNIIDGKKVTEEQARAKFADASNQQDVDLAVFQGALNKLADENKVAVDDFTKALASKGEAMVNALAVAAANALQGAFK